MVKLKSAAKLYALSVALPLTMFTGMASACTPNCVDGTNHNNLVTTWNGGDTFTIKTKNGAPLCNDLTLYGSSYVLTNPAYKGGLFGAPGSYPQSLFKTVTTTLPKDKKDLKVTVTVPLSPCGNQQVDLYYGPEIKTVGAAGHGSQYINGNIITPFNKTTCTPGQGGGPTPPVTPPITPTPTTTTTPTPPAVVASATTVAPVATVAPAATLSDTGTNTTVTSLLASAFIAAAAFVVSRRTKVSE
jgi:hypothetical protein